MKNEKIGRSERTEVRQSLAAWMVGRPVSAATIAEALTDLTLSPEEILADILLGEFGHLQATKDRIEEAQKLQGHMSVALFEKDKGQFEGEGSFSSLLIQMGGIFFTMSYPQSENAQKAFISAVKKMRSSCKKAIIELQEQNKLLTVTPEAFESWVSKREHTPVTLLWALIDPALSPQEVVDDMLNRSDGALRVDQTMIDYLDDLRRFHVQDFTVIDEENYILQRLYLGLEQFTKKTMALAEPPNLEIWADDDRMTRYLLDEHTEKQQKLVEELFELRNLHRKAICLLVVETIPGKTE
jgi:hypothetical protein